MFTTSKNISEKGNQICQNEDDKPVQEIKTNNNNDDDNHKIIFD